MAVNVPGLAAVVVFDIVILVIGIWASRKSKKVEKTCAGTKSEVAIVGGRNINVLVGIFTMTATWVGGGYILGTAEAVYSPSQGLIWAMGPPAYLTNFVLGGLFFAKPMRSKRYVTMLDPFQHRYGNMLTATLLLPALMSDILWVACILAALVALPAVADVSHTINLNQTIGTSWVGELKLEDAGKWADEMLLLALGGLAYQALYQRILSAASSAQAQLSLEQWLRLQASERELQWVIRISVLVVGLAGTGLAFGDDSVFGLWLVSSDLLYCVLFPQLICVLHCGFANSYGAFSGFTMGLLLRALSGEPLLGIPAVILYPGWREVHGVIVQYFPFRTLAMLASLTGVIAVSWLVQLGFYHKLIPQSWDLLGAFEEKTKGQEEEVPVPLEEKNNILNTKL
ncbi:hypothetical protein JOQ06_002294 [Pogonophryne albipinna]|uniref:High-affinity choline transporter 1-like n=1 Tax=Pogonophryne albipinna TaxID=1090488 RepID=A0AAD6B8N3_9TELE|nr:hypothetical protein JOQ06_002294 [Pogonophryne albipinna]